MSVSPFPTPPPKKKKALPRLFPYELDGKWGVIH